jgi:hypothetical protein
VHVQWGKDWRGICQETRRSGVCFDNSEEGGSIGFHEG